MKSFRPAMLGLLLLSATAVAQGPDETVTAFNESISEQNIEAAISHLAEGAVQFNLHGSHADLATGDPEPTQDLAAVWRVVSTVLFNTLEDYERSVEILASRVDGAIATVWTQTTTSTQRSADTPPTSLTFTETYLLLRKPDGWKIAGLANNRPAEPTAGRP